jgi:hypothetical protein
MECNFSVKLVPLWYTSQQTGKKYVEQVIVYMDGYPSGLMHIDTFYVDRKGYDQLREGKTFEGTITISAPDPEDEDGE